MTVGAEIWRNKPRRLRMEGGQCPNCRRPHFPARPVCRGCGERMELPPFIEWKKMENGEMAMREVRPDLLRDQNRDGKNGDPVLLDQNTLRMILAGITT